jgi:hypothetical protein
MYIYKIQCGGYEDWFREVIAHETEFTKEQFDDLVLDSMLDAYHKHKADCRKYKIFRHHDMAIMEILSDTMEILKEKHGFTDYEEVFTQDFGCFMDTGVRRRKHEKDSDEDSDEGTMKVWAFFKKHLGAYRKPKEPQWYLKQCAEVDQRWKEEMENE